MTFQARALILLREPGTRPLRGAIWDVNGVPTGFLSLIKLIYAKHLQSRNRKYLSSGRRPPRMSADTSAIVKSGQQMRGRGTNAAETSRMMLWTAPTLRHQGAIRWLRRNGPLEGSRPWARLARSVSISRSRFFKFTAWTPMARWCVAGLRRQVPLQEGARPVDGAGVQLRRILPGKHRDLGVRRQRG